MDPVHLEGLTMESTVEGGEGPAMKIGQGIDSGRITNRYVDPNRFGEIKTRPGARGDGRGTGMGDGTASSEGCEDTEAKVLNQVEADYTVLARRRGVEGQVVFLVTIGRDGRASSVELVDGLGFGLDEAAEAAIRQWRFEPATRNCEPVSSRRRVAYEFEISEY